MAWRDRNTRMGGPQPIASRSRERPPARGCLLHRRPLARLLSKYNPYAMGDGIVGKIDPNFTWWERFEIQLCMANATAHAVRIFHDDLVKCRPMTYDNLEARPVSRNARRDQQ